MVVAPHETSIADQDSVRIVGATTMFRLHPALAQALATPDS